ncbi:glycosyltransferase family 4 protein [Oxalicibacterium faecigallinarum]|uniref:Glycosyl transferase n=1 Tax=Oxalicibacterium faecigallinarum TaxID=573741 RepID=A0A8J3AQJ8_9BURK|nr:glycosyltransferase family 1 protein [Oxalicibacterium faecigallinarum]GGI17954.1 glycosyl transferase [Oxalicibacterium faecigallinarum]
MRIAIVTDAWTPQVNGVVNTLRATRKQLRLMGHAVRMVTPEGLRTYSCPTYPEIRLSYKPYSKVAAVLDSFMPDCIHIATEGPMGLAARRYCLSNGLDFTTAYHTRFPEYLRARFHLPLAVTYRWLQWFHGPSKAVMVPTPRMQHTLEKSGFRNVVQWSRGVDTEHFRPGPREESSLTRPVYLYVGRLAVEKNIEAFLQMELPGSKWVIGDGPMRDELERRYPGVRFLGNKAHDALPGYYNCADVFVFPSRTDTFGLVMIEAMACGVPVAAYPVEGPIDVVADGRSGILNDDLMRACFNALTLKRSAVREYALSYSWEAATQQFLRNLHPVRRVTHAILPQTSTI